MSVSRPTLLFDGNCGICRSWVAYWRALTEERIIFRPYQEAAGEFPALAEEDLASAIVLIEPDGQAFWGAAATFRLLRQTPGRGVWWWVYAHVPGFAAISEVAYSFLARRRGLLAALTGLLWGQERLPERMALVRFVFLRCFGAIYVSAFVALSVQIRGLVGHAGLLPLGPYLAAAHAGWGTAAYWRLPTLFWLNSSDLALQVACLLGAACGIFVIFGVFVRAALVCAFILYLSLVYAGQIFTNYQWDQLLLEAGFLAIFLTSGAPLVIFLFRWLVFRFLFLAGVMKLLSGDPSWRHLTALDTHFWTQPLPAPLAWPASELPPILLHAGTGATLVVELILVFLIFLPRRPRMLAAWSVLVFQMMIIATGNYNFFNLLTMLLCLFLFDDQVLRRFVPARLVSYAQAHAPQPGGVARSIAVVLAIIVIPVGVDRIWQAFAHHDLPMVGLLTKAVSPLLIVNPYGLFPTTTVTRPEIVIEGSDDGQSWRPYALPYYPGPLKRAPSWNIPYQPRLDWQMWFAAYGNATDNPWFVALMRALLENRPAVLALFADTPFPKHPPRYVRAELFDYRFADPAQWARSGQWWQRRLAGLYFPPISLAAFSHVQP
ncbi:MAG: lipase maturation factor family protein [Methylovirgula sp.]